MDSIVKQSKKVISCLEGVKEAMPTDATIMKSKEKLEAAARKVADLNPAWSAEMDKYQQCERSPTAENIIVGTGMVSEAVSNARSSVNAIKNVKSYLGPAGSVVTNAAPIAAAVSGTVGAGVGAVKSLHWIKDHQDQCRRQKQSEVHDSEPEKAVDHPMGEGIAGSENRSKKSRL